MMSGKERPSPAAAEAEQDTALDLDVLDTFVGYHLRRCSMTFAADLNRSIGRFGVRQVPFAVLTVIARHPGINQGAVGQALGIQRANMVALVSELLGLGLIERSEAEGDRRAFALSLTPAGEALVKPCIALIREHEARLLSGFSPNERHTLISLLTRIEIKGE